MENQSELNQLVKEQNELVRDLNSVNKAVADVINEKFKNNKSKQQPAHELQLNLERLNSINAAIACMMLVNTAFRHNEGRLLVGDSIEFANKLEYFREMRENIQVELQKNLDALLTD